MVIHDVKQRTKEWEKLKLGKVGGSEIIGITTPARMKTLVNVKLAEIFTGEAEDVYVTEAMQYGIDNEDLVIGIYESETFIRTKKVGYITKETIPLIGLSPDVVVFSEFGEEIHGAVEVKCLQPKAYVNYILESEKKKGLDRIPAEYRPQVGHYFFMIDDLKWLDFVVYNEKFSHNIHIVRVSREDAEQELKKLEAGIRAFHEKIQEGLTIISKFN
jgi:hypothetical protein